MKKLLPHQIDDRVAHITSRIRPKEGYLLYDLAREVSPEGLIVEIGSAYGASAAYMGLGKPDDAQMILIDNFSYRALGETTPGLLEANLQKIGVKPFTIIVADSLVYKPPKVPDLVHIDGNHDYRHVWSDLVNIANGAPVIVCHDYNDPPHQLDVTRAVDDFCRVYDYHVSKTVQRMAVLEKGGASE